MAKEQIKSFRFHDDVLKIIENISVLENKKRNDSGLSRLTDTEIVENALRFFYTNYYNEEAISKIRERDNEYIYNLIKSAIKENMSLIGDSYGELRDVLQKLIIEIKKGEKNE